MSTSHFSVVIPTYNRLDFLKQALASVWAQTYKDYEIIVVDDGSTDGTADYLMSLGARVKAVHQENRGPAAARNLGVKHAKGEYLAFLDSDDLWQPWTLATFYEVIRRYKQPTLISAATCEFEGEAPNALQESLNSEWFRDYLTTANNPSYVGSDALVIKRKIFNLANGFDEGMSVGEDLDFYFRVGMAGSFVRVLSPMTLGKRRHVGNMSTVLSSLHRAAVELLKREFESRYPGGEARKIERWRLLSRAVRPVAFSCLKAGLQNEAWHLYRQSFQMNARLGRFRFLAGFPLCGLFVLMGRDPTYPRAHAGSQGVRGSNN
jgi:glycosyltransferase involved in cell wall biosynthesis